MKRLIVFIFLLISLSMGTSFGQDKRFGLDVEVGYSEALSSTYDSYEVFVSPGIHFGEKFFGGIGLGYKRMKPRHEVSLSGIYLPAGDLDNTPFFIHAKVSPYSFGKFNTFVSLKAGYGYISNAYTSWGLGNYDDGYGGESNENRDKYEKKFNGGLFLSPAIGVSYSFGRFSTFSLSIAYDLQNYMIKWTHVNNNIITHSDKQNESNSAVALRLGWGF
ncbi:MAG: hypothetical protein ACRDCN_07130 [Tannerellaceae bacterium]